MKHRNLWIYLAVYAAVCLTLFMSMEISISNGYARSVSAAYIADSIQTGQLSVQHFIEGEEKYKIFSGIADWEPLQVMLLTLSFLIFGINKFAYTIVPLLVSFGALVYTYFLTLLAYPKRTDIALTATILVSLSTFFFFEAASPMLENGVVLVTFAALYHFMKWHNEDNIKHFYILCLVLGLGVIWKSISLFVLIPLGITWVKSRNIPSVSTIGKGMLIFIVVVSPLVAREVMLSKYDVDQGADRTFGKLHYLLPQGLGASGYITADDMEFQQGISEEKKYLIDHRYELSYLQKGWVVLTSTFYNVMLLVLLIGWFIFCRKQANHVERMLIVFIGFNVIFFTLFGLIPRYMVPATAATCILGAKLLGDRIIKTSPLKVATIFSLVVFTFLFLFSVANNEHVMSKQYDYEGTVNEIMATTEGNFTIQTFRPYQMSFYLFKHDVERRGRIDFIDGNKNWTEAFAWTVIQEIDCMHSKCTLEVKQ